MTPSKTPADRRSFGSKSLIMSTLFILVPTILLIIAEMDSRINARLMFMDEIRSIEKNLFNLKELTPQTNRAYQDALIGLDDERQQYDLLEEHFGAIRADLLLRESRAEMAEKQLQLLILNGTGENGTGDARITVDALIHNHLLLQIDGYAQKTKLSEKEIEIRSTKDEINFINRTRQAIADFATPPATSFADSNSVYEFILKTHRKIPALNDRESIAEFAVFNFDLDLFGTLELWDDENTNYQDVLAQLQQTAQALTVTLDARLDKLKETLSKSTEQSSEPPALDHKQQADPGLFERLVGRQSTTHLTVLLGLCSGCLGALFLGLANPQPNTALYLMKGAVAGLVAIFVVKGGNTLLSLNVPGAMDVSNPFSVAFIGFGVGLFSDRLFVYLESLVDKATNSDKATGPEDAGADDSA